MDKMKQIEKQFDYRVDDHMIVRIDGHKFSKFTKKFKTDKPFDEIITNSMIVVAKKLMKKYNAVTGYTQSDEITLIFPSFKDKNGWSHIFGGRIQKISSLLAGFATMEFINELFKKTGEIHKVYFDARVFATKDDKELCQAILSRINDGIRNSKNTFAHFYVGHKKLMNKSSNEQIELVKKEYNKDWNELTEKEKFGTIIKKKKFINDKGIERSKLIELNSIIPLINCCEEKYIKLIKEKYYES
jgi:tRNA(His) 5'-end guanylyltransferase